MRSSIISIAVALLALSGCGDPEPVTYPAGQRPCVESTNALGVVTLLQLRAGSGPIDPDGAVRQALEDAKEPLSYRAGESPHYSAAAYNWAAALVLSTIDPLIEAYDAEDPDTPHVDSEEYDSAYSAYNAALMALSTECTSGYPSAR